MTTGFENNSMAPASCWSHAEVVLAMRSLSSLAPEESFNHLQSNAETLDNLSATQGVGTNCLLAAPSAKATTSMVMAT